MKVIESCPTIHVFICNSCTKEGGGKPSEDGVGVRFQSTVKRMAAQRWSKNLVRINSSGCLGMCAKGINCVIYPGGKWVTNLAPGDEHKIIKIIQEIHDNHPTKSP